MSSSTTVSLVSISASIFFSVSACGTFLGKPSSRNPDFPSGSASRSRTIATVISSGTRSPRSMYSLALAPRSVLLATLYRKMSPVDMRGIDM